MRQETRTGYLLTLAAAVVWAATSPGIKYLIETEHVPALAVAFWRDAFIALACVLALLAAALLVRAYDPVVLRVSWQGTLVGLGTGMAHAGYVLFSQRSVESRSPWTSLTYTMLFGALTLLALWFIAAAIGAAPAATPDIVRAVGGTPGPWLGLLVLALGPTLGGYALFTIALRHLPGRIA